MGNGCSSWLTNKIKPSVTQSELDRPNRFAYQDPVESYYRGSESVESRGYKRRRRVSIDPSVETISEGGVLPGGKHKASPKPGRLYLVRQESTYSDEVEIANQEYTTHHSVTCTRACILVHRRLYCNHQTNIGETWLKRLPACDTDLDDAKSQSKRRKFLMNLPQVSSEVTIRKSRPSRRYKLRHRDAVKQAIMKAQQQAEEAEKASHDALNPLTLLHASTKRRPSMGSEKASIDPSPSRSESNQSERRKSGPRSPSNQFLQCQLNVSSTDSDEDGASSRHRRAISNRSQSSGSDGGRRKVKRDVKSRSSAVMSSPSSPEITRSSVSATSTASLPDPKNHPTSKSMHSDLSGVTAGNQLAGFAEHYNHSHPMNGQTTITSGHTKPSNTQTTTSHHAHPTDTHTRRISLTDPVDIQMKKIADLTDPMNILTKKISDLTHPTKIQPTITQGHTQPAKIQTRASDHVHPTNTHPAIISGHTPLTTQTALISGHPPMRAPDHKQLSHLPPVRFSDHAHQKDLYFPRPADRPNSQPGADDSNKVPAGVGEKKLALSGMLEGRDNLESRGSGTPCDNPKAGIVGNGNGVNLTQHNLNANAGEERATFSGICEHYDEPAHSKGDAEFGYFLYGSSSDSDLELSPAKACCLRFLCIQLKKM